MRYSTCTWVNVEKKKQSLSYYRCVTQWHSKTLQTVCPAIIQQHMCLSRHATRCLLDPCFVQVLLYFLRAPLACMLSDQDPTPIGTNTASKSSKFSDASETSKGFQSTLSAVAMPHRLSDKPIQRSLGLALWVVALVHGAPASLIRLDGL